MERSFDHYSRNVVASEVYGNLEEDVEMTRPLLRVLAVTALRDSETETVFRERGGETGGETSLRGL